MSKATQILMDEHRVIERVLDCVERMAGLASAEGRLDAAPVRDAVDFLRHFADGCHHAKEEHRLFPMMERHGFSPDRGPTAVMRHEHELGRALIRRIAGSADGLELGRERDVAEFVEAARGYVALLREHIKKEDHCLFPMADGALDEAEQRELLEGFDEAEREEVGEGAHARYVAVAESLEQRFPPVAVG